MNAGQIIISQLKEKTAHGLSYDDAQTVVCNKLRDMLQSIAIFAVRAQEQIGDVDPCADTISAMQDDLDAAKALVHALGTNGFYR